MLHSPTRLPRRNFVAVVATLLALLGVVPGASGAAAGPTPVGGKAWTVPVIRLYDITPRLYREGIDIAIRSWNESRVGVRFARTSRRDRAHVVVGTARYPGDVAGKATLGMTKGAWVRLDTALIATEHDERNGTIFNLAGGAVPEDIADTMAHELGHVLGLKHTRGCSLMLVNELPSCGLRRPEGMWACRLQQRRDLVAMSRRYGGPGALRSVPFCALSATPAGRVGVITATASTRSLATSLRWGNTTNTYGYVVARSAAGGPCPTDPASGTPQASNEHREPWGADRVAARYCFAVWSKNGRGALTGPIHTLADVRPPTVAPIGNLQATAAGSTVQFTWTNPPGTRVVRIYRSSEPGATGCTVPPFLPVVRAVGGASSGAERDVPSGTWTYVATRSDDPSDDPESDAPPEWPSAPACITVTVP
jgi:hypothetical protein